MSGPSFRMAEVLNPDIYRAHWPKFPYSTERPILPHTSSIINMLDIRSSLECDHKENKDFTNVEMLRI